MVEGSSLHNFFEQFNHNGLLFTIFEYTNSFKAFEQLSFYNIKTLFVALKPEVSPLAFMSYSFASFLFFCFVFFFRIKEFNDLGFKLINIFFKTLSFLIKNILYFFTLFLAIFMLY